MLGKNSQCWKDLKAKTRFTSYNDHVKAYKHRDRLWFWNSLYDLEKDLDESVKRYFSQRPDPSLCPSNCFMIDLFKSTDLAVNLRQRWVGSSGTEILEALQNPPRDACVQVFIWHIMRDIGISPPLVDAFGLGLGISPQFFKALYLLLKGKPLEQDLTKHEIELRPLRSDFVVIGNAVITISRYQPSETNSVPVVLIAGNWIPDERRWSVSDCVDQDLRETPALQPPVGENLHRGMLSLALQAHIAGRISQRVYDDIKDGCWGYSYFELLKVLLKRDDIRGKSGDTLSFVVLLPLMQLDVLWIRRSCRLLRLILPNAGSERGVDIARIHADRRSLRRSVENVEDSLDHLTMHSTWPNLKAWLREPVYQDVEQQMRQCFRQARRLEAEARDYLQLEAGLLALRESQTSIELSNQQIQEGKRRE